jgi:hypothetical protein
MEPIKTKSNGGTYLTIGIVVALIVVGLLLSNKKSSTDDMVTPTPVDTTTPGTTTSTTSPGSTTTGPGIDPNREGISVGSGAGTYANLMLKYKGRMVQFNKECAVVSNKVTFKQGTDILLDNRDDTAAKIVIGSRTFNLPAYGYKVIDLPTIGSYQLDCNKRLNVVTVSVQK